MCEWQFVVGKLVRSPVGDLMGYNGGDWERDNRDCMSKVMTE